jgi:hypothetical protein
VACSPAIFGIRGAGAGFSNLRAVTKNPVGETGKAQSVQVDCPAGRAKPLEAEEDIIVDQAPVLCAAASATPLAWT